MKRSIYTILAILSLFVAAGCSDSSKSPCETPTVSECLDSGYCEDCVEEGADIETICGKVLQSHYNKSKRELALVPELSGSEETLRERYDVAYSNQPYLYVPRAVVPETYFLRNTKLELLNINDNLLAAVTLHPLLPDLNFNPVAPLLGQSISKAVANPVQITPPIRLDQPNYMFEGLSYTRDIMEDYLDSLYTGKVGAWNANGNRVESCEEYTYEKFYDFSLFKDFMSLHADDHLRVVEYAFRGSNVDQNGISIDVNNLPAGSVGSKFMSTFGLAGAPKPLSDVIQRKGGEPRSIFEEMAIGYYFNPKYGTSSFYKTSSPDVDVEVYWDHVFSQNQIRILCGYASPECIETPDPNFMPKNFFVEVLGSINKSNQDRRLGIVLSHTDLVSLMDTDMLGYAKECYDNTFKYHFLMYKAAKRLYPNSSTLKRKLLEYRLLRKHLIQLMAERSRYEQYNFALQGTFSQRVLRNSETLPPSEKSYAKMKLDDGAGNIIAVKSANKAKSFELVFIDDDLVDDIVNPVSRLMAIDDQIQALLLEAKTKGCFDIAIWDGTQHNYPTVNNDGETMDLQFNKALSDWTPEMFTTAAVDLIPDSYYENVYADCMRVTGGDFDDMNVDSYQFDFPGQCAENTLFAIWSPNQTRNYTTDTVTFHKFESLMKKYPEALLDCDSIIQGQTKKALSEADMNYYDPATGKVMMSKSRSYYDSIGGEYAGLNFGYALGWLYEGYDDIAAIETQNPTGADLDLVCEKTGFFAFGNYFAGGSFLGRDFTLCSAGSYASNKTSGVRPVPPTLSRVENENRINSEIQEVATASAVNTTYFMFVKNEKMTFNYDNGNFTQTPVKTIHSQPFSGDTLAYQSPVPEAQMISVNVQKSVPVCGIISITIRGAVTGDIDASTLVNTDKKVMYGGVDSCKAMNYSFTPRMDFDAFAQASVTAGLSGVASVSAGVETGLKFVGVRFPYNAQLSVTQKNGIPQDRLFNYDVNVNAFNNLDQELTLLSGFFGAFVKIEYVIGSDTYRQTLFSWDGIRFGGNVDRVGHLGEDGITPLSVPVRALYGLSKNRYK